MLPDSFTKLEEVVAAGVCTAEVFTAAAVELSWVVVNGGSCCLLALSTEAPQLVDDPEPLRTRSILLAE